LELRNFKFGMQMEHQGHYKKCKSRSKRVLRGSHNLLLKFWDPFHISERVGARNFKFGVQTDHQEH